MPVRTFPQHSAMSASATRPREVLTRERPISWQLLYKILQILYRFSETPRSPVHKDFLLA